MGPPDEPPHDVSRLIAIERSRLLELLQTLTPPDWERPTPCPAWSVHGLCCHLIGDDLGVLARNRDGYFGTVPPPGDEADFIAWLDDLQVEWVHAARRMSPRLVLDLLAWSGPQLSEHFAAQDLRARTAQVTWAGPDMVPVWLDQLRELSEYWIHRQQLLEALGRPEDLRADLAGPVLDGLRWAYPFRLAATRGNPGDTITIQIGGPLSEDWHFVSDSAGWQPASHAGKREVCRLTVSTSELWRLLTNNLAGSDHSRLDVRGRPDIVEVVRRTRAIIGAPN